MTEITNINNTAAEARSIETVTAEIVAIRGHAARVVLESAVEIGRRLVEAKELLPHGEWGKWLKEKVDFSQDSATRLMNAYKGYASSQGSLFGAELNSAALRNLSITNALLLLKVPEEEREEFAREVDAEHVSSRELERIIRERDAAIAKADAVEQLRADAVKDVEELERYIADQDEKLANARVELDEARSKITEMESRPVEVAVQEPDPAEVQKQIDAAVKEAKAAAEKEKKALKDKLADAEKRQKELEAEVERQKKEANEAEKKAIEEQAGLVSMEKARLEKEIEGLKKQLAMSDAAVASFHVLFDQAQDILSRMIGALGGISDDETAAKLRAATGKLLEAYGEKVSG